MLTQERLKELLSYDPLYQWSAMANANYANQFGYGGLNNGKNTTI